MSPTTFFFFSKTHTHTTNNKQQQHPPVVVVHRVPKARRVHDRELELHALLADLVHARRNVDGLVDALFGCGERVVGREPFLGEEQRVDQGALAEAAFA